MSTKLSDFLNLKEKMFKPLTQTSIATYTAASLKIKIPRAYCKTKNCRTTFNFGHFGQSLRVRNFRPNINILNVVLYMYSRFKYRTFNACMNDMNAYELHYMYICRCKQRLNERRYM